MNGRWTRLEGLGLEGLAGKHAVVAGLGSGGSTVALELAKSGVGRFTLVDPDWLELPNVIRHECDAEYLGTSKVAAVADLIRRRNAEVEVDALPVDAFALGDRLARTVARADIVVACTDSEPPKRLLNRLALGSGVPAVYGGVYERGAGGEVVRCGGGPHDPCYACVTSVLKEAVPLPESDEEPSYGVGTDEESLAAVPGLGLDVRLVALLHAKVCLLTLLGRQDELSGNVLLFGTETVEGLFPRPFASAVLDVAPQDGCLVCGPYRSGEFGGHLMSAFACRLQRERR